MGKTYTPTYRVEYYDQLGKHTALWTLPGKPTPDKLAAWITSYHASLKIGGCNEHLSKSYGFVPFAHKAFIIRQSTRKEICTWRAPLFVIVE